MLKNKNKWGKGWGYPNADMADKGRRRISKLMTLADKGGRGVQTLPNMTDKICVHNFANKISHPHKSVLKNYLYGKMLRPRTTNTSIEIMHV